MNDEQPLAEFRILAWMMSDETHRKRCLADGIADHHFQTHRIVFETLAEMHRAGRLIDPATVAGEASERSLPSDDYNPHEWVEKMANSVPDGSGYARWLNILRRSYAARISSDVATVLQESNDPDSNRATMEAALDEMRLALTGPTGAIKADQLFAEFAGELNEMRELGEFPGIQTGFPELDDISGGMRPGEFWVVMGKPGKGKTALMLQIALNASGTSKPSLGFSCEMMRTQLMARLCANAGKINLTNLLQPGKWRQEEMKGMKRAKEFMMNRNIFIDDTPKMTLSHVQTESERISDSEGGLSLVFVDYIQILQTDFRRGESRQQQLGRISGGLKQLAKQLRCPVIAGSQMNKDNEAREAADIEQDADAILKIADDGFFVSKMRNGEPGRALHLTLNGAFQRFE